MRAAVSEEPAEERKTDAKVVRKRDIKAQEKSDSSEIKKNLLASRWSLKERALFIQAVERYGKDFLKI